MLVIAHRGASSELPENTLPAFERAIELGADFVELDVHADAAGRLVVTHDRAAAGPRLSDARRGARPDARPDPGDGRAEDAAPLPPPRRRCAHGAAARRRRRRLVLPAAPARRGARSSAPRSGRCSTSATESRYEVRAAPGPRVSRIVASPVAASTPRAASASSRLSIRSMTRIGCGSSKPAASRGSSPTASKRRSGYFAELTRRSARSSQACWISTPQPGPGGDLDRAAVPRRAPARRALPATGSTRPASIENST